MSSLIVRNTIKSFITTNLPLEKLVDLSGEFDHLNDLLAHNRVTGQMNWIGIQFIGNSETTTSLNANNSAGCYRELGTIILNIVDVSRVGVASKILLRAEICRNLFRGRNISGIRIEEVSPPNFSDGATLNFEGKYTSASIYIGYESDLNL